MDSWRYVERFGTADPGAWFRIMPVGAFQRFGREVKITLDKLREMAANFGRVPQTRLPVTLEHKDDGGKVGDIAEMELRDDGLYARFEWLERGLSLLADGAFQYFSPEVLWGPTDYEGQQVSNVLMGVTLTNSPFFGEAVSVYTLADKTEGKALPDGSFPNDGKLISKEDELDEKTLAEAVAEAFKGVFKPEPKPEPAAVVDVEQFNAIREKAEQAEAELAKLRQQADEERKQAERKARVEKFAAVLGDKLDADKELPAMLADMAEQYPDQADKLAAQFKALAAQVDTVKLFGELGRDGGPDAVADPAEKFIAQAEQMVKDGKADNLADAFAVVAQADPEAYRAYRKQSAEASKEN